MPTSDTAEDGKGIHFSNERRRIFILINNYPAVGATAAPKTTNHLVSSVVNFTMATKFSWLFGASN